MVKISSKNDRRFDDRHPGTGLVARIGEQELEVLDISIGGLKIPNPKGLKTWRGDVLDFVLASTHWPDMKHASGKGVVRALNDDWIALQFERPSYDLMKCVSRHVATLLWGDKPYGY
ncbi:MAG: PilZ domain-containing protein [Pseudomonadota bacterium]